ncbi:MAG: quinolinate synthase NadA [Alphaproteobacteria bacterium]
MKETISISPAVREILSRAERVIPAIEWPIHAAYIEQIMEWKKKRNAVILAHTYQTPEIYHCVADIIGDSLKLAQDAATVKADVMVMAGVHFMAETAKLVNPNKTVLIPDLEAGCSLASSITAADVALLRQKYPNTPVVTYVNTSAAVKAESDICCTSSNAVAVVESLNVPQVIFLPDEYLAAYVATQTKTRIISWKGHCEVHERFTAQEIKDIRTAHPNIVVLAHPECPPDVLQEADFIGSTSAMSSFVQKKSPQRVVMITECSMSDNVAVDNPNVEFIRPCNLCPHMKKITLANILTALQEMKHEVIIPPEMSAKAMAAVHKMLAVS